MEKDNGVELKSVHPVQSDEGRIFLIHLTLMEHKIFMKSCIFIC